MNINDWHGGQPSKSFFVNRQEGGFNLPVNSGYSLRFEPTQFGNFMASGWNDQSFKVTLTMPAGLSSWQILFDGRTDEGHDNESYGIDNLVVTQSEGEPYAHMYDGGTWNDLPTWSTRPGIAELTVPNINWQPGEPNDGGGWSTALTVLMFERLSIGTSSIGYSAERFAAGVLSAPGAAEDPEVRQRLGHVGTEMIASRFAGHRLLSDLAGGKLPGPEFGLGKVTVVKSAIEAGDLLADVLGPDALDTGSEWGYIISFLPGLKSAGGTEEILRNTIGERVLGLPPEPRSDKGVPFSELKAREKEEVA